MNFLTNEQLRRGFPLQEINRYVETGNGAIAAKMFDDWIDEQGGIRYSNAAQAARYYKETATELVPGFDAANVDAFLDKYITFVSKLEVEIGRFKRGERLGIADALYYENFLWRNSEVFDHARRYYNDAEFQLTQANRETRVLGSFELNAIDNDHLRQQPRPIDERRRPRSDMESASTLDENGDKKDNVEQVASFKQPYPKLPRLL